ncbi:MAG: 4-alpha-glucanotransferase [Ruminococcaceae bacterium]|nr:4-alpha-glucanotransferase [Oscillospiraceae bacterium]
MKRSAGVLLAVSSLPGPYGAGVLGRHARNWIDRLAGMGFHWWQVLPTVPAGKGYSPYAGVSACAGSPVYIDPEQLREQGLLTDDELAACVWSGDPNQAAYEFAYTSRITALRRAFARAQDVQIMLDGFVKENPWALDYARFMAIKADQKDRPWTEWPEPLRRAGSLAVKEKLEALADEVRFWLFVQYEFRCQWYELRTYAQLKGVQIVGDLPIYVSADSADVWANPDVFMLGDDALPSKVAGVPPDFFSADGQLWGNPLYDWENCAKNGYSWWVERLRQAGKLYDLTRIDHFRGFSAFWAVDASAETARDGVWMDGPGKALFDAVYRELPDIRLFAEDLGDCDERVRQLLRDTGIPGTKVLEFGFGGGWDSDHVPHKYPADSVAYSSTHDNNTLLGWLFEIPEWERTRALRYAGFADGDWGEGGSRAPACRALIETLWKSGAGLTVLPLQDMCGFGRDTRMNTPGTPKGNWLYRATEATLDSIDAGYFREINEMYGRM